MLVITAPDKYYANDSDIVCFLAGGITGCYKWQSEVIDLLKERVITGIDLSRLVIINPRRDNFLMDDPFVAQEQITWEFNMLERCDIFSMYFCDSESDQPICMYELGRNIPRMQMRFPVSWRSRIIVSVEEGYRRSQDVGIQTNLATGWHINVDIFGSVSYHVNQIVEAYQKILANKIK